MSPIRTRRGNSAITTRGRPGDMRGKLSDSVEHDHRNVPYYSIINAVTSLSQTRICVGAGKSTDSTKLSQFRAAASRMRCAGRCRAGIPAAVVPALVIRDLGMGLNNGAQLGYVVI
jgi:hypothetical protein